MFNKYTKNYKLKLYMLNTNIFKEFGELNPFISICNRNAKPSAQTPIKNIKYIIMLLKININYNLIKY